MRLFTVLILLASSGYAQLLPDQKLIDFQQLAALFAKQYAPYEWKRDALGVDLLRIAPWLERVRSSKDDLEFYEVCAQYVASLTDAHSQFFLPSDFFATIGFEVDLYDGKPLIEFIDAATARSFSFRTGDELVSFDGKTVPEWLKEFGKYTVFGNSRSTDRSNASLITYRLQSIYPRAAQIGDDATVVVRHKSTGLLETYQVPWEKGGLPISIVGPVPSPKLNAARDAAQPEPSYLKLLSDLQNLRLPAQKNLRGVGEVTPIFQPSFPASFVRRLGRSTDFFYSGTFVASGKRIGFIRVPDFLAFDGPDAAPFALRQFETEITFLEANTDGLVVDITRNPGGDGCYAENLLRRLIPYRFRGLGQEVRVTRAWILAFSEAIADAEFFGVDQSIINRLKLILAELQRAYQLNRGRTDAIPQCGISFERDPASSSSGNPIVYTKPVLLLTDEFTISAAEIFAAIFQDSKRGQVFGWRTAGAGGSVGSPVTTGFYSEAQASVTESLLVRSEQVFGTEYPTTSYIENVGVRPDIAVDYMTEANLTNRGKAFFDAFTAAMVGLIK
jgi:hypothetical protein